MRFTVRNERLARSIHKLLVLHSALLVRPDQARCQELEPRAYAANPIGVRFAVAAFVTTTGNVVLDPTSPVSDVRATLHSVVLGAGGTFALAGRSATASVAILYAWGTVTGKVAETASSIERSGLADARLRLDLVNAEGWTCCLDTPEGWMAYDRSGEESRLTAEEMWKRFAVRP